MVRYMLVKDGKSVSEVAEGIFESAIDFVLWFVAYSTSVDLTDYRFDKFYKAQLEADKFVQKISYQTIRNAFSNARKTGLINKYKHNAPPEITQAGYRRLKNSMPKYQKIRNWDQKIYLITYDIPETRHYERNKFRKFIVKLGCAMLQNSVWLTAYNPSDIIRKYKAENNLHATVIVSSIGRDGFIGDYDIKDLIAEVYKLEGINKRYQKWINTKFMSGRFKILSYLKILKIDPQLPFELLPDWWVGDTAYKITEPLLNMVNDVSGRTPEIPL